MAAILDLYLPEGMIHARGHHEARDAIHDAFVDREGYAHDGLRLLLREVHLFEGHLQRGGAERAPGPQRLVGTLHEGCPGRPGVLVDLLFAGRHPTLFLAPQRARGPPDERERLPAQKLAVASVSRYEEVLLVRELLLVNREDLIEVPVERVGGGFLAMFMQYDAFLGHSPFLTARGPSLHLVARRPKDRKSGARALWWG